MRTVMNMLGTFTGIYSFLIFLRIVLTWFSSSHYSGFQRFLSPITDPYLNWFKRFSFLQAGGIDFSAIAAMGVLSVLGSIFFQLARYGRISVGVLLALVSTTAWSIISFLLGLLIVVMILYLVYLNITRNSVLPFWRVVEMLASGVLKRINLLFFKNRIISHNSAAAVTLGLLLLTNLAGGILVGFLGRALAALPF